MRTLSYAQECDLRKTSKLWALHARQCGSRMDVTRKQRECEDFSLTEPVLSDRGAVFALPTSLIRVASRQGLLRYIRQSEIEHRPLRLEVKHARILVRVMLCDPNASGVEDVTWHEIGEIKPKHGLWLLPLLYYRGHGVKATLLSITGGTHDKPTLGVTIAIHHMEAALRDKDDNLALETALRAAERKAKQALTPWSVKPRTFDEAKAITDALFI